MPTPALIATQLTDRGARPLTITIGALDVTTKVDIETVSVTEEGPGGRSSMRFTAWDPGLTVTLAEGDPIEFWDNTNARPLFAGYLQSWSYKPATTGRYVEVEAVGVEVLLDWAMLTSELSWPINEIFEDINSTTVVEVLGAIVAESTGLGPIRTGVSAGQSTQATPIANVYPAIRNPNILTLTVGMSVRAAIDAFWAALVLNTGPLGGIPLPLRFTIDYTMGLRVWMSDSQPTDYANLTIVDTIAGATAASILDHEVDAASVVRGVLVRALTDETFVSDGSGRIGAIDVLDIHDDWLGFPEVQVSLGLAYLEANAASVRGAVTIANYNPTTNIRAGSQVVITDAPAGLAAESYTIASITKTFHKTSAGVRQKWTVAYGGLRPSAMRSIGGRL